MVGNTLSTSQSQERHVIVISDFFDDELTLEVATPEICTTKSSDYKYLTMMKSLPSMD